jgi:hypothetical protein
MVQAQPPAQQGGQPWLPPSPPPYLMEEFQGLYTSTTRPGVKPEQCWWIDGYIPLGRNDLRTMPGAGPAVFTAPAGKSIAFFDFGNIGATPYGIVIGATGEIYAVNTNTGASSTIAPAATITNPSKQNVGITQYGSQYILIVANQTNGYFIWDGTTFFKPGDTFTGTGGGTMPTAIAGTTVEIYAGRVWIANGATVFFSVPGSLTNFSSGSGGGNFTSTDSFLRVGYSQLIQTNGFLYLIGDSSINYISGVQTAGSPPVTTFTNQNADPEVGTPYSASVDVIGRNIVFANAWGIHVSYGAAVTKISEPCDGFYTSVPNFGGQQLSGAKAIVYGKRLWCLLCPVIDQFTGQQRNKLIIWNSQLWFVSEQDVSLTYIQHQEINSVLTAWGTDGTTLRRLFQQPSTGFTKRVMSKFWASQVGIAMRQTATRFWASAQYYSLLDPDVNVYIESENAASFGLNAQKLLVPGTTNVQWTTMVGGVSTPMNWTTMVLGVSTPMKWTTTNAGGIVVFDPQNISQQGMYLGFTLETNAADMAWISAMIADALWNYRG